MKDAMQKIAALMGKGGQTHGPSSISGPKAPDAGFREALDRAQESLDRSAAKKPDLGESPRPVVPDEQAVAEGEDLGGKDADTAAQGKDPGGKHVDTEAQADGAKKAGEGAAVATAGAGGVAAAGTTQTAAAGSRAQATPTTTDGRAVALAETQGGAGKLGALLGTRSGLGVPAALLGTPGGTGQGGRENGPGTAGVSTASNPGSEGVSTAAGQIDVTPKATPPVLQDVAAKTSEGTAPGPTGQSGAALPAGKSVSAALVQGDGAATRTAAVVPGGDNSPKPADSSIKASGGSGEPFPAPRAETPLNQGRYVMARRPVRSDLQGRSTQATVATVAETDGDDAALRVAQRAPAQTGSRNPGTGSGNAQTLPGAVSAEVDDLLAATRGGGREQGASAGEAAKGTALPEASKGAAGNREGHSSGPNGKASAPAAGTTWSAPPATTLDGRAQAPKTESGATPGAQQAASSQSGDESGSKNAGSAHERSAASTRWGSGLDSQARGSGSEGTNASQTVAMDTAASTDRPTPSRSLQTAPPDAGRFANLTKEALQQIVRGVEADFQDDLSTLRMQLSPGRLGDLELKLAVEQGVLTARFVAQSEEVKALIESALPDLRQNLAGQGVAVDQLSVSVGEQGKGHESESFGDSQADGGKRRRSGASNVSRSGPVEREILSQTNVDVLV